MWIGANVGTVLGQLLGNAVGVAISPVPVIALILMLFSPAAARNSLSFLLGWVLGLAGVSAVVVAVGLGSPTGGGSILGGGLKAVVGLLFLGLAWRQWQGRPREGSEAQLPGWMGAIDQLTAGKAIGMGLLLTVANPKNLGLTLAAAATVSAGGLTGAQEAITVALFVLIASLSILVPVLAYLVARERVTPALDALKGWLVTNSSVVMAVLFLVLGAKVLGDGISVLAS